MQKCIECNLIEHWYTSNSLLLSSLSTRLFTYLYSNDLIVPVKTGPRFIGGLNVKPVLSVLIILCLLPLDIIASDEPLFPGDS